MRIEILHLQATDTGTDVSMLVTPTIEECIRLLKLGFYERIAVVDTEDEEHDSHLGFAWHVTQNLTGPWVMGDYIEENDCAIERRSSMVGDLFVAGDMPFLVAATGFECLVPGHDPI
jgi:hypothetical protein